MCIKPFLKTRWEWQNWSNFAQGPFDFSFNLLTMKVRQIKRQYVGDQYGIQGITRYRFQERYVWSDKWTDWETLECYDTDYNHKTDEDFETYYGDEEGYEYDE